MHIYLYICIYIYNIQAPVGGGGGIILLHESFYLGASCMMGGARYGRGGLQSICITAFCTRVDFDRRVAPVCAPLVHADGAIVCPLPLVARLPTSSMPPALPASWTLVALYLARCFE